MFRRNVTIDRAHISAARWKQGPLERRYGLATVRLLSRGRHNPDVPLQRIDAADARLIAAEFRSGARQPSTPPRP